MSSKYFKNKQENKTPDNQKGRGGKSNSKSAKPSQVKKAGRGK